MDAKRKPFVTVQDQNNQDIFWIPKPTPKNVLNCVAAFDVMQYLPFVDALNRLPYANVKNISSIDELMSFVIIELVEENSLTKIIEDISELLSTYVELSTPTERVHHGKG